MTTLLEVRDLTKVYPLTRGLLQRTSGEVRAVDGLSFEIGAGETLGLVGESGCGKSTVARCILGLTPPTSGTVSFDGDDIASLGHAGLRQYRRRAQIVFQDPFGTLNPRMNVEQLLTEPLRAHAMVDGRHEARRRVRELLEVVGLSSEHAGRYPHECSGGQRQRVAIARALTVEPRLLVLDEPVAALDVSIGAQILNLLADLQDEFAVSYLLISHDLSLIRQVTDRVAVMYLGTLVESAAVDELFTAAQHPYTQALLSAVPLPDPELERSRERLPLPGEVPGGLAIPSGCRFHTRCFRAEPSCAEHEPVLELVAPENHRAACWFAEPREAGAVPAFTTPH